MFQEDSSTAHGLSCEPNPLPLSSNKTELDSNYENMIENLLLQQVLLYSREQSTSAYSRSATTANSVWIRQQPIKLAETLDNEQLVLTSSPRETATHDDEPTLCLIESNPDTNHASSLIESILYQYNQRRDNHTRFDEDLMDLILHRNRERKSATTAVNSGFHFRLQWLAIGLVIDRLFFYLYFTATLVSYFVTLGLIPFSHPNLKIDIDAL